jgi:hypothetical protein
MGRNYLAHITNTKLPNQLEFPKEKFSLYTLPRGFQGKKVKMIPITDFPKAVENNHNNPLA